MSDMLANRMNSDTEDNLCWFHGRLARDDADKVLKEG